MKTILLILFVTLCLDGLAQSPIYSYSDSTLKIEVLKIVKQRAKKFNKGVEPKYFESEVQLLDSLRKNNISNVISITCFSLNDQNRDRPYFVSAKSSTMDKQIPFIRYKYKASEFGEICITIIQGHNDF